MLQRGKAAHPYRETLRRRVVEHFALTYVGLRRKSSLAKIERPGLRRQVAAFKTAMCRVVPTCRAGIGAGGSADVSAHSQMLIRTTIVTLLLAVVALCLFGYVLNSLSGSIRQFEVALLSLRWMLLVCMVVWCGTFIFLTFGLNDLPLIGLLLIVITAFFIGLAKNSPATDALILIFGVTLGKGMRIALMKDEKSNSEIVNRKSAIVNVLVGLVLLLAFASWWQLDMTNNFYHGPRWMGLWDNPNIYGMLMGAGVLLSIGLLTQNLKSEKLKAEMEKKTETGNLKPEANQKVQPALTLFRRDKSGNQKLLIGFLFVAAFIMGVGLVMSYSRGAWVGTAIGLLYLAKHTKAESGKRKAEIVWYVAPIIIIAVAVIVAFWNTPRTAPWYFQRLDLSRGSVQHRVAAWEAGFEMIRDHPFGVGWGTALVTYEKNYSPPEDGAAAITMNDYLMLGTQLGIPALLCFIAYVALQLGISERILKKAKSGTHLRTASARQERKAEIAGEAARVDTRPTALDSGRWTLDARLRIACRSAAIAMLVAFWFDGGLFKLATASVFWILLELGVERQKLKTETLKAESGGQFRHLTPALSPDEAEREPKAEIGNPPSPSCSATSTSAATE